MTSQVRCRLCNWSSDFIPSQMIHLDAHQLKHTLHDYCELYQLVDNQILESLTPKKKHWWNR